MHVEVKKQMFCMKNFLKTEVEKDLGVIISSNLKWINISTMQLKNPTQIFHKQTHKKMENITRND
jgi:hypothetical protein